jgi:hypothetical protein
VTADYDGNTDGYIYTSSDSGATWTQHTGPGKHWWWSAAMSADGSTMAVLGDDSFINISTDGGTTWTAQTNIGIQQWWTVDVSDDGTQILAAIYGGGLYRAVLGVSTSVGGDGDTTATGTGSTPPSTPGVPSTGFGPALRVIPAYSSLITGSMMMVGSVIFAALVYWRSRTPMLS